MNLLPFQEIAPYAPRKLVPARIDLGNWAEIAPLFDALEDRLRDCRSVADLEAWLADQSELLAALDEEGSKRYIAMTCHTDNPEAERAYLQFVEKIEPEIKPRRIRLDKLFLENPLNAQLPARRHEVLLRDAKLSVELFRPENVPLETEEAKLGQQYQKLSGSLTVQFRGEEKTLAQMAKHLEEPDRALRQEAWELMARRRLQEKERFESLFEQLFEIRKEIAANAGFANYRDYAFRARGRFDYTPEDCLRFHQAVESEVMPAFRQLQQRRREQLGLETLRPWDLSVDPKNRPPLRPFQEARELAEKTGKIFSDLDGGLAAGFQRIRDLSLLDLANRKGKAPGGYQTALPEARLPFIFMNAVGLQRDVETLLHEAGHAFHSLATQPETLYPYRIAPLEFCEVASMSMELLGNERLERFYSPEDARRARRKHLEGIIEIFPWIATVDAFQHWIYLHPNHSAAERAAGWRSVMDRFGGAVDWRRHEEARAYLWHRQLHIFLHPFYYIEYGIAQLGALQVWANSKRDRARALEQYQAALRLGGSRPLPELFAAAGCRFDFSPSTVRPLIELTRAELDRLKED